MPTVFRNIAWAMLLVLLAGTVPAAAQDDTAKRAVTLPVTGSFAKGGEFSGTVTINRFAVRGDKVVAIGFVQGTLSRGGPAIATGLAGEVVWPVVVTAGGISTAGGRMPAKARLIRVGWSANPQPAASIVPVQAGCSVVDIAFGPVDVNILGVVVSLSPIALSLTGEEGTPLGTLLCAVLGLLTTVAELVNVLNGILGLLTGLLGGLTGGL